MTGLVTTVTSQHNYPFLNKASCDNVANLSTTDPSNESASNITNEVWYLDLSSLFNTATPPWNKDVGMPIGYFYGASCSTSVYVFNSNTSLWTTPIIIGFNSSFKMRSGNQPVIDNYGKIYTYGGANYTGFDKPYIDFNDMSIFDTTSMTWSTLAISMNTPLPYLQYTATLLPTGIIVYIGGYIYRSGILYEPVSMYEIQIFNTKNYNWSTKKASGDYIDTRAFHSAVLSAMWNDSTIPATPYIAKLNTNSWMWSIPNLSQINSPQLCYHSAELYGDYMIIAFGQIPSKSSMSYSALSNNLYILDIKNYTWVTSFSQNQAFPPNKSTTNQTPSPENNLNNYLFVGIGTGAGIVLLGVFSVIGFLLYKRKRQNQYPKFIPTLGTTDRI
ncbi:galactose oxidase [Gigaspora margarita]|uniref:Galactose oxidase n=1 Tax=Gigaspora margarita TaxID=4874 RepID=A0A8H4ESS2_GIGMA|nr:galactose oxidase [Gigaspora margarita]